MKIRPVISILVLLLSGSAAAPAADAQTGAQSASGSYQFSLEDGRAKYVEFDARTREGGGATGQMFFSDEAQLDEQDVDGTGGPLESHRGFYLRAEFDGLLVVNNRAVMSGTVRDSSIAGLIGQRVLLTAEDNRNNPGEPDKLTWGIYARAERGWETSDAELERDEGVGMRWLATDAERRDDEGFEMPGVESVDTQTFPLAAYDFVDLERWTGDIRVQA
jgi:hypothetical protein